MIVKCLEDCQVVVGSKEFVLESIDGSPNIYEVNREVGKAAVATKKCVEILVDDEHPYTGPEPEAPIIHPLTSSAPALEPKGKGKGKGKKEPEPEPEPEPEDEP